MDIAKHLQEHLEANPHIHEVHFNSAGEWVFKPRKTHLLIMTRAQVMAQKGKDAAPTKEEKEVKNTSKK